jgi:hypothetical protein
VTDRKSLSDLVWCPAVGFFLRSLKDGQNVYGFCGRVNLVVAGPAGTFEPPLAASEDSAASQRFSRSTG